MPNQGRVVAQPQSPVPQFETEAWAEGLSDRRESARIHIGKLLAAARREVRIAESNSRVEIARAWTHVAITEYWNARQEDAYRWSVRSLPAEVSLESLSITAHSLARDFGVAAAVLDLHEASYHLGVLYTITLPPKVRSELGAFYTPPALCGRLIDMATQAGVDWQSARVLDPACGGGAFLAPLAQRMVQALGAVDPATKLRDLLERLRGYELDPFAAWMSEVFLETALLDLCRSAGTRLPRIVEVGDSLTRELTEASFDLVIGNPPYGRVQLTPDLRHKYRRSLYGHANLYGLFTDLALRLVALNGVVAYVTPTGFLSGEYFKALRGLLGRDAPPVAFGFVEERKGVFADALQEAMLATYRRDGVPRRQGAAHVIQQTEAGGVRVSESVTFDLPTDPSQPWLVPRARQHHRLLVGARRLSHRLRDYGYKVSTGPLVWNRHRAGLRNEPGKGRYPLLWSESVRSNGRFEFRAQSRNRQRYFEPDASEHWVVTETPCVLLQRTTAKEQARRLIAAELPAVFIAEHGGVVVENHLNMIRPLSPDPVVSTTALTALLRTSVLDEVFRCISGSVAVSAYELGALPLPEPDDLHEVDALLSQGASFTQIDAYVRTLYERVMVR